MVQDKEKEARIRSVAIIGAGAAGAVTAAAFKAENYYERIRVFERREGAGGTWIYDADPLPVPPIQPGALPGEIDPPLRIPETLPTTTPPDRQERYAQTPIYSSLTTNVPDIAMCFSDRRFAYGPFAPHYVPRQYIESYFSNHETDSFLVLGTTVEDLSRVPAEGGNGANRWKLVLRRYDSIRRVDAWWEEIFDAVVIATGHYSVPYIPNVKGLKEFVAKFPGRVVHSKLYRSPATYTGQRVLIVGNSASGRDLSTELVSTAALPVYQSRRSPSRWDGATPPEGIVWKPVAQEYLPETGSILFTDGTVLDDIDTVIYCTGYQPSFPFWNVDANEGLPLYDHAAGRLVGSYWHTFFRRWPTVGIVGMPRALTFRSFEYQAIALARLWSGRNSASLPGVKEQEAWEREREERTRRERKKFHDVAWDDGETHEWLGWLFEIAGLCTLKGEGMTPPPLGEDLVWAIEHIRKYPEPGRPDSAGRDGEGGGETLADEGDDWVLVGRGSSKKDSLAFI